MNENNKKTNKLIIALLVVIIALLGFIGIKLIDKNEVPAEVSINNKVSDANISNNQSEIDKTTEIAPTETEYTEFIGFGTLVIDEENPYVYLQNPESNTVYMQFEVECNGKEIYESELISPGHQEQLEVYTDFEEGEHTLSYNITTYDVETKELCMAGIAQEQKINVVKGEK